VQVGWVLFDLALAAALVRLARRWRTGLDLALAALVSADAALTTFEAVTFNLRRVPRAPADVLVSLLAIAGPALAAGALWRGVAKDLRRRGALLRQR
jgi:hypothetical protein